MSGGADLTTLRVEEARAILAAVRSLPEAKELRAQAGALEQYTRRRDAASGAHADAWEIAQYASRRLGELCKGMPTHPTGGGRPRKENLPTDGQVTSKSDELKRVGISRAEASRLEQLAGLSDEEYDARIKRGRDRITRVAMDPSGIIATSSSSEHDGDSWGTPPEYLQMARVVLGGIEIDPASNHFAQATVQAGRYYTKETDGRAQSWKCKVGGLWLNQPYSRGLVSEFAKLWVERREDYVHRSGGGGMMLVNSSTETGWFQNALEHCTAVLFPKERLAFIDPATGKAVENNDRPQALFYTGPKLPLFRREASKFGQVMVRA
jgi:phage N-6-adenine-methyltransferase